MEYGTYREPFVGAAAIFLGFTPKTAVLSDANTELINIYQQVKDDPEALLNELDGMPNSKEDYYRIRESRPRTDLKRAARLIYLVNLSFNGIFRVNASGHYNVPYGQNSKRAILDPSNLMKVHEALQGVRLRTGDFAITTKSAKSGDLVYCDPPYTVAHNKNGFIQYNKDIFSWKTNLDWHAMRGNSRNEASMWQ